MADKDKDNALYLIDSDGDTYHRKCAGADAAEMIPYTGDLDEECVECGEVLDATNDSDDPDDDDDPEEEED